MKEKPIIIGISVLVFTLILVPLLVVYYGCNLSLGDFYSFGQFWIEFILMPVVLFGLYKTYRELKESQARPDIKIYWEPITNDLRESLEIELPSGHGARQTPRLVVKNEGNAIARWYLIRFDIPRKFYIRDEPRINRLIGDTENGIEFDPHWSLDRQPEKVGVTFMSHGKYALYPNYPQQLCAINFNFDGEIQYPESCEIPYFVYTDRGSVKQSKLVLQSIRKRL
jgi:hypothetical protein